MARTADYVRKTKETDISLHLNLDGTGSSSIPVSYTHLDVYKRQSRVWMSITGL